MPLQLFDLFRLSVKEGKIDPVFGFLRDMYIAKKEITIALDVSEHMIKPF
jgi:hypothetical protein